MFQNDLFHIHPFDQVPLGRDISLMEEKWQEDYEREWLKEFDGEPSKVGYHAFAVVNEIYSESIELSLYLSFERFHEIQTVILPRSEFITCIELPSYGGKPVVFVSNEWLDYTFKKPYSVYALVDAIGVKNSIYKGTLTSAKLRILRDRIDAIAERNQDVAFVSFADSLLLKSNYNLGKYDSSVSYNYNPERIIQLLPEIDNAYRQELGMNTYTVLAQGSNQYDDKVLHTSVSGNHVSLNSLGTPFAQVMAIDTAARIAMKEMRHEPGELYIDKALFHSLGLPYAYRNQKGKFAYSPPLGRSESYYYVEYYNNLCNRLR